MKRICLFILMIMAMLFVLPTSGVQGFAGEAQAQSVKITGNGVRLRYGPGLDYGVYCKFNKGKILTYRYTDGDWYCVRYNNMDLYVSRDFASLTNVSTPRPAARSYSHVIVQAKNLRVRTGPSVNYPYLVWTATGATVHLNYGDVLTYLGEVRNGFYKVSFDGKVCWIATQYAKLR